jgi:hypothetical protein
LTACNEDTAAALAGNGDALTVAVPPATQAGLLRDIFGSLFRPAPLDPAWLTGRDGLLVLMARRMYDSRDFTDMRILADVLEEAGCTDEQVLGHVRGPGPHVRGCWFLDVLLGKS